MHTVAVLEQALQLAKKLGIKLREEWLDGAGGGACEIRGRPWIFLDVSQSPDEQLAQVAAALRGHPGLKSVAVPACLRLLLRLPLSPETAVPPPGRRAS
ncbi:MAG TPA: hypothetical protein VGE52_11335 [Pirellulales bacterium]